MPPGKTAKAFVLDDSIKSRFGKKMPGVSSHFDHTLDRLVMGQPVLTDGYSCEPGFVPLDNELFISHSKAQELHQPFQDGRSIVAKRYRQAPNQTKPEIAKSMMSRAVRAGIDANYMLADAWFGTKAMRGSAEDLSLTAIVRMKKGKLKYRLTSYKNGEKMTQHLDLQELYKQTVRMAEHFRATISMQNSGCRTQSGRLTGKDRAMAKGSFIVCTRQYLHSQKKSWQT